MRNHWLLFVWVLAIMLVLVIKSEELLTNITSISKHEFCSGKQHVGVDPKYIPALLDCLKHCNSRAKEPNVDSYKRRQAAIHLFNEATPVIHRAFFDGKTALKYVILFTKLKHDTVQYTNYANKYGGCSLHARKKVVPTEGTLSYTPAEDEGSYNLNEDLRTCTRILDRQQNTNVRNIIKESQLPRVAKAARIVTFPPFNLSIAVSSEDTPYLILDMYVQAMRCLSFTNVPPNTTVQVSDHLIGVLKRKVMPFVSPREFDRAYKGMMSISRGPVGRALIIARQGSHTPLSAGGILTATGIRELVTPKCQPTGSKIWNQKRTGFTIPPVEYHSKKSYPETFLALLRGRAKHDNSTMMTKKWSMKEGDQSKALPVITAVFGICGTLAVILYFLLFGCCGWLTVTPEMGPQVGVDEYLDRYARLKVSGKRQTKCCCAMVDSNQMEVIAALHQRCERLSKKICRVAREISQENVSDTPESMDVLREFVRSVSKHMVDENESIYHFGKSYPSLIKPQNKATSVSQDSL